MKILKLIRNLSTYIIVSSVLATGSCKKKTEKDDAQSVVDNSICEQEFNQIQPTANSKAINTKGTGATLKMAGTFSYTPCDTLHLLSGDTVWAGPNHKDPLYEYDFSTCGNANGDGFLRTGKYMIRLTGPIKTTGSKMIIKLSGYKVNGISYSCDSMIVETLSSAFTGTVAGSLPESYRFKVDVINGTCAGNGWSVSFNSSKTIDTQTQGTAQPSDDITTINGTSSGKNRQGVTYTAAISNIIKKGDCPHISQGTIDITPEGFDVRTVDFGDGTCDDNATYTVKGQKIAFKL
ncbi:MAG: hypothetical protein ACXVPQ_11565 [Bacteroidia bacterium]